MMSPDSAPGLNHTSPTGLAVNVGNTVSPTFGFRYTLTTSCRSAGTSATLRNTGNPSTLVPVG